ncbi:MAG: IclR family transcriptional regulator [Candidatus Omnitrophica bacterium]|nr:IclR family transcriptional regulator [Candidatus Omnitrophota bacterium]MCA9448608.1 IclR family transcriptional regulator [Candidatus Omnitrophota bacterium]
MIVKTFDIIERLRENPDGLTYMDLVEKNPDIPKISIYRILCSLEVLGYLEKDPITAKYCLGAKFIELGRVTENRQDIIRVTRPFMQKLCHKYGENVNLVKLVDGEYVRLAQVEGTHPLRVMEMTSRYDDVYSSAATKIILAYLPEEECRAVVDMLKFKRLTHTTITSKKVFYRELEDVRRKGYAIDNEENLIGVRCIGAAIRDHDGYPIAGISVSGPTSRINDEKIDEIGRHLVDLTESISHRYFAFEPSKHGVELAVAK